MTTPANKEPIQAVAWWIPKAEQFCIAKQSGERPFVKAWEPLYTKEQLEDAIAQERERIAKLFDNGSDNPLGFHIAAAIRASA